jgi:hypothetical protein
MMIHHPERTNQMINPLLNRFEKRSIKKNPKGYVLVSVLFLAVFVSMLLGFFVTWLHSTFDNARSIQQRHEGLINMANAEANVIYWFLTHPMSVRGLEIKASKQDKEWKLIESEKNEEEQKQYIALNSKAYKQGPIIMGIQDESGLVNVNKLSELGVKRLLSVLGVDENERGPLAAKLKDYVEFDGTNQKRVDGAGAADYEQAGKNPPSGEAIRTPFEAKLIMDWDKQDKLWKNHRFIKFITTYAGPPVNLNTTPLTMFEFIPKITPEIVKEIKKKRDSDKPFFKNVDEVEKVTGVKLGANKKSFSVVPLNVHRLYIEDSRSGLAQMISITILSGGNKAPWQVNFRVPMTPFLNKKSIDENNDENDKKPEIPDFPDPAVFLGDS